MFSADAEAVICAGASVHSLNVVCCTAWRLHRRQGTCNVDRALQPSVRTMKSQSLFLDPGHGCRLDVLAHGSQPTRFRFRFHSWFCSVHAGHGVTCNSGHLFSSSCPFLLPLAGIQNVQRVLQYACYWDTLQHMPQPRLTGDYICVYTALLHCIRVLPVPAASGPPSSTCQYP